MTRIYLELALSVVLLSTALIIKLVQIVRGR